jgi:hypothetical protein
MDDITKNVVAGLIVALTVWAVSRAWDRWRRKGKGA